jgi:hypothetical protein
MPLAIPRELESVPPYTELADLDSGSTSQENEDVASRFRFVDFWGKWVLESSENSPQERVKKIKQFLDRVRATVEDQQTRKSVNFVLDVYSSLGQHAGRAERQSAFRAAGPRAIRLLIQKAKSETDIERLAEIASLIASVGEFSTADILPVLSAPATLRGEFIETILRAIRWRRNGLPENEASELASVLRTLREIPDKDVRESTYETAEVLPHRMALRFLEESRQHETDGQLLAVIDELTNEIG